MEALRIYLFGKFNICHSGNQLAADYQSRKVQELFCYLLLRRDRHHPREALASLLWSESTTSQSRKQLRQALWQLQTVLASAPGTGAASRGDARTDNGSVLQVDPDWVRVNPEATFWLDVAEFERACALVHGRPGQALDKPQIQIAQEALKLYRGDLLEGWYQDWCLFERERLQRMYLDLLEKQMAYCESHGEYEAGLECGTCALRYDMAHERIHRRLMRLYHLSGNRTAALRQYERCVTFLREELGVTPSARTLRLYEDIRLDRPLRAAPATSVGSYDPVPENERETLAKTPSALIQTLQHLKQLQTTFTQTQRHLQEVIQAVEAALKDQD